MCYDRVPSSPREAIKIMGDLVRHTDESNHSLHIEAVNRMKLMEAEIKQLQADAKRYRFIRDLMAVESSPGSWCLFDSAYKGSSFNEAIDKEMMGYE